MTFRRKATVSVILLLLALAMLNLVDYRWTKEPQQCNTQARHTPLKTRTSPAVPGKRKQLVYVFTTGRTGSSFFGELFNQNPGVFFLYEPIWHIWQKLYPGDAISLQGAARDMLSALYRCDLSILQLYNNGNKNMTSMEIFRAASNKVICSEPICNAYRKNVVGMVDEKICKKCPPRPLSVLEEECHKYNTIVIKGIRIFDINILAPLLKDPNLDLKVINLVRDPRAVASSRIKSGFVLKGGRVQILRSRDTKVRTHPFVDVNHKYNNTYGSYNYTVDAMEVMEVICSTMAKSLNTVRNRPDWLKGKFLVVRYEDLVEDPVKTLRQVYNFVNLYVNQDIETFALNMTKGSSNTFQPFDVSSRNGTQAVTAWRTLLNFQQIKQVEEYCHQMMALLGYQRVKTPEEVTDLSKPLLEQPKV